MYFRFHKLLMRLPVAVRKQNARAVWGLSGSHLMPGYRLSGTRWTFDILVGAAWEEEGAKQSGASVNIAIPVPVPVPIPVPLFLELGIILHFPLFLPLCSCSRSCGLTCC